MSMKFRTEITITPSVNKIDQHKKLLSLGSCFASLVAERLRRYGVATLSNPLGELYNPLSIERCVRRFRDGELFSKEELCQRGDVWFSYHTHGVFDTTDPDALVERLNGVVRDGQRWLQEADCVILTLGTSWVYEREGEVVANCHKMPAREFLRRRLTTQEVVASLERVVEMLAPRKVILTISPIRHLGDGLEGNSLSKAVLRVAVDELVQRNERVCYFPAYEILLDDLRDYRYYAEDMTHPSGVAVEYVWERFRECFMSGEAQAKGEAFARLAEAADHRPLHPESEEYARFREGVLGKAKTLAEEFPDNEVASQLVAKLEI